MTAEGNKPGFSIALDCSKCTSDSAVTLHIVIVPFRVIERYGNARHEDHVIWSTIIITKLVTKVFKG